MSLALRAAGIDELVLHTGQHYDPELSQVFFDELSLGEPALKMVSPALKVFSSDTATTWLIPASEMNVKYGFLFKLSRESRPSFEKTSIDFFEPESRRAP